MPSRLLDARHPTDAVHKRRPAGCVLEAAPGFEPGYGALQVEKWGSETSAEGQGAQVRVHRGPHAFRLIPGVPRDPRGMEWDSVSEFRSASVALPRASGLGTSRRNSSG